MENDVTRDFAGDIEDNSDDESDELERYRNTKFSFTNDDALSKW
jgi:hypothetical protein